MRAGEPATLTQPSRCRFGTTAALRRWGAGLMHVTGEHAMRSLPILAALIASLGLGACTYVERQPERPVVLQQQPAAPTYVAPPAMAVRPSY
jgi:hypothetical protein